MKHFNFLLAFHFLQDFIILKLFPMPLLYALISWNCWHITCKYFSFYNARNIKTCINVHNVSLKTIHIRWYTYNFKRLIKSFFLGDKNGQCFWLTALPLHVPIVWKCWETCYSSRGLSRPVQGELYLYKARPSSPIQTYIVTPLSHTK